MSKLQYTFNTILFILVTILTTRVINFFNIDEIAYYGALVSLCLIVLLPTLYSFKSNILLFIFLFTILLSLLLNDIPIVFSPYIKFLFFSFLLISLGPYFSSLKHAVILKKILSYFIFLFTLIVLISFLLRGRLPTDGFYYSGITNQSMVLGPISAIVIIYYFCNLNLQTKRKKYIFILLILISSAILLLTSSRAAIGATILACCFYLFVKSKNPLNYFKYIFSIMFMISMTYPLWDDYLEGINKKMEIQESMNGETSRSVMWDARLLEFNSSPIYGIGYASVFVNSAGYSYDNEGSVEYGSGWLGLLSSIGILGLISFTLLFINIFWGLYKYRNKNEQIPFYLSIMVFFASHIIYEGYILSSGNILSIFFWTILGYSNEIKNRIRNSN